ncbi:MAG: hypothetical protein M4579_004375 [Chaenotheca gracillima]|nr:MAG: hypothetical protein M4579_004375 [Chaenotheca gracillima]
MGSNPHHILLVADPQLVDPHTYPGRPWPISTLSVKYTDIYLWRNFKQMLRFLQPDTLFFLGDLFDGGREWTGDGRGSSSEDQWRSYGDSFWLREYARFNRIFFDLWLSEGGQASSEPRGRKIIASLPGNHDLGLGIGIQLSVRDRFGAYFGEGNRVDVIGNHTFVSVDTVSLSAMGQYDPAAQDMTGSKEPKAEDRSEKVWGPAKRFLDDLHDLKKRAVDTELQYQRGLQQPIRAQHQVAKIDSSLSAKSESSREREAVDLPTVLLTHIPLYRQPGTPCGPLREHWPPSPPKKGELKPLEKDERNAIQVRAGYQYQNVLTPEISKTLVDKVGNVAHVFSGDDHDYCEVFHKGYTSSSGSSSTLGGLKEITVKSISFAMGVRRPGFQMLSLWNPLENNVNADKSAVSPEGSDVSGMTMQSHLCLLPDQLGIFIRYLCLIIITFVGLAIRAFAVSSGYVRHSKAEDDVPDYILPLSKAHGVSSSAEAEKNSDSDYKAHQSQYQPGNLSDSSQSSTTSNRSNAGGLAARSAAARTRSTSPATNGYAMPLVNHAQNSNGLSSGKEYQVQAIDNAGPGMASAWNSDRTDRSRGSHTANRRRSFFSEYIRSVWRVAWVVLLWYFWLLRTG